MHALHNASICCIGSLAVMIAIGFVILTLLAIPRSAWASMRSLTTESCPVLHASWSAVFPYCKLEDKKKSKLKTLGLKMESTGNQHRKRQIISFPATNLVSVENSTSRQLADQDVMTLLQYQKCHAAASSSATTVVTVGIASGRGEGRGRERGKGEGGRK